MDVKRKISCMVCGEVELSEKEYSRQLSSAETQWMCPHCGNTANWLGEYYRCVDSTCTGWAEETCDVCGRNQYELFLLREEGDV